MKKSNGITIMIMIVIIMAIMINSERKTSLESSKLCSQRPMFLERNGKFLVSGMIFRFSSQLSLIPLIAFTNQ